jgi:glycosyltransferase involved in cell wall biosynthesis
VPAATDLFVGWSSFCEQSLKRAAGAGAVTVVERGSAHIAYQRDILREEYELQGIWAELPDPHIVERETREYALADYISVPSSFARRTFLDAGVPAERLICLPYGVDVTEFAAVPRNDDVFRLVYAGGMTLQKGVHYLLQAFAGLRLPRAELWLIGAMAPEIEPFFRRYAGTFRYIPHVPQAQLRSLYGQCSAFALCSVQDGFGMVLLQAMSCGLPLITTTNTGGPDVIEEGIDGFVIPIRDVERLQERILELYESPERCRDMGMRARRKVEAQFSWDHYGAHVVDAYRRAVNGGQALSAGSGRHD